MKFLKKVASAALAASMILGSGAANVLAADYPSISQGTVSSFVNGKTNTVADKHLKVGETGSYKRQPSLKLVGANCGHVASEVLPDLYRYEAPVISNPEVITDSAFTLQTVTSGTYAGYPGLSFDFKAAQPGKTTVSLTYYYNFQVKGESGYCKFCGTYTTIPRNYNWYKDTVTFTVEVTQDKHTVIYTDGVAGEIVFPDQGYEVEEGSATPEFEGTPTREGYDFMGWAPAVSPTVTGDVTYTATWQKKEEPKPEIFTITYTDGVEGEEIFADQTYEVEKGAATPKFVGTPTREGYDFMGWAPAIAETVTGPVEYVATWQKKEEPKPDEPGKKESMPGIDKKLIVGDTEVTDGVVAKGTTVKFELNSTLPDALLDKYVTGWHSEDGSEEKAVAEGNYVLTFHDVMDAAYTDRSDFTVKVGENPLDATDYTVADAEDGCSFHISMDLIALYNAKKITKDDIKAARPVTVEYTAIYNPEATTGAFKNKAWVAGTDVPENSDEVEADLFGIKAKKVDSKTSATLSGAEFTLWKDEAKTEKVADGICGEDGIVSFDNLTAGTYYLEETKAPAGYIRNTSLIEVVVNKEADANDGTVDFFVSRDVANAAAPHTGGAGTTLFTAGGAALLGAAVLVAVSKKRKQAK